MLQQAFRLLKEGGEMYFLMCMQIVAYPKIWLTTKNYGGNVLVVHCVYNDFDRLAKECGFKDLRLVTDSVITIDG